MKKLISVILAGALAMTAFTACSSKPKTLTSEELITIINDNGGEMTEYNPAVAVDDAESGMSMFYELNEIDSANVAGGAMSFSLINVQAHNIAVLIPAEGKGDRLEEDMKGYIETTAKSFENYLADQYEIAQNAIVKQEKGYVIVVMTENAQQVYDGIVAALG